MAIDAVTVTSCGGMVSSFCCSLSRVYLICCNLCGIISYWYLHLFSTICLGDCLSEHAEQFGFGVIDRFVGHGVGTVFHSEPFIFHHRE